MSARLNAMYLTGSVNPVHQIRAWHVGLAVRYVTLILADLTGLLDQYVAPLPLVFSSLTSLELCNSQNPCLMQ